MKYMGSIVLTLLIMVTASAHRLPKLILSTQQKNMLVEAYQLGGLRFAAIILEESSGCAVLHGQLDPLAFGCGQLHQDTADGIAGKHVSRKTLMHNCYLNMQIAVEQLNRCTKIFGKFGGITCYKWGIPASLTFSPWRLIHSRYLRAIEFRMRQLQALPISED